MFLASALLVSCSGGSPTNGAIGAAGHGGIGAGGAAGPGGVGGPGGAASFGGSHGGAGGSASAGVSGALGGTSPGGVSGSLAGAAAVTGQGGAAGLGGSPTAGHTGGGAGGGPGASGGTSASGGAPGAAGATGNGGGGPGAGGANGSCDPASLVWQYLLSCDTVTAGIVHTCVDYYATPAAAASSTISFRGACLGTVLSSPCPTANSAGSCLVVASIGVIQTSSTAAYSRQYGYTDLGNVTAAGWAMTCKNVNQPYYPPGSAANAGVPTLVCPAPGPGGTTGNGFAFAVSTVFNGETLQCTNYYGMVSSSQLATLIANDSAMTTPCPAHNAVCTCPLDAGGLSSVGVTSAKAVSYSTSLLPMTGCDASAGPNCTSGYTPP